VSQDGQIIALPWLFTQSAHQPFPHSEQIPCEGVDVWFAQRRQALPLGRAGRGLAVCDARAGAAPVAAGGDAAGVAGFGTGAGRAAGGAGGGADAAGAGAIANDASPTTKTVLQPLQRALRPGSPSLSGGTRRGLRHVGQRTVTLGRDYSRRMSSASSRDRYQAGEVTSDAVGLRDRLSSGAIGSQR
jgi:hypothetical protein